MASTIVVEGYVFLQEERVTWQKTRFNSYGVYIPTKQKYRITSEAAEVYNMECWLTSDIKLKFDKGKYYSFNVEDTFPFAITGGKEITGYMCPSIVIRSSYFVLQNLQDSTFLCGKVKNDAQLLGGNADCDDGNSQTAVTRELKEEGGIQLSLQIATVDSKGFKSEDFEGSQATFLGTGSLVKVYARESPAKYQPSDKKTVLYDFFFEAQVDQWSDQGGTKMTVQQVVQSWNRRKPRAKNSSDLVTLSGSEFQTLETARYGNNNCLPVSVVDKAGS